MTWWERVFEDAREQTAEQSPPPPRPSRARELALFSVSLLVVAGAGFAAGRMGAPAEVEERVEYRTEWRTKTVEIVRWRTARAVDTRTTSTPVLLPAPDGGVVLAAATVTETRERETASGTSDTTSSTSGADSAVGERKVTQLADWRVGAQVGATLRDPLLPIAGPLVLGASVEARLGNTPFSAGLWFNTVGAAGVSLSGEF